MPFFTVGPSPSALLVLCVFLAGCAAHGNRLPAGAWVLDTSESEKYLLANPPADKLDSGFFMMGALACSWVFTVTPEGELKIGIPKEPQKVTFTRVESDGDAMVFESVRADGRRDRLTATLQGQHIRLDDGDNLKYLLWRRSKDKDPKPDFVEWGPKDVCLGPLDRIWQRFGTKP